MKEYLNEGLTIHTKIYYTLQRGKRMFTENVPRWTRKKDTWFEFEAYMYPPLMLMPTTWKRYGYTSEDVHTSYEKMDASYVWQIALMLLCGSYEPEAASAGVRPTFQSPFTFLFISRKTVFDVFISAQNAFISPKAGSVLCRERMDHKPPLPKVQISWKIFDQAKSLVPSRHPSFCWCADYPKLFPYKDIFLVPVEYDEAHQLLYMVRAVKKDVFDAIPVKPKVCIVTLPVVITVKGVEYVLTEEACFFHAGPRPPESRKVASIKSIVTGVVPTRKRGASQGPLLGGRVKRARHQ